MKKITLCLFNLLFLMVLLTGCTFNSSFLISGGLEEKTIYVGDKILLNVNLDNYSSIEWKSNDETIATVDEQGIVEGISQGTTEIVVNVDNDSATITINVIDLNNSTTIDITGKQSVLINNTITLTATTDIKDAKIVWTTSDSSIATIDQTGTVKGIKPGVVTIRATLASDYSVFKEVLILVRTGDGVQEIINNYINKNINITSGNYDLTELNNKVVNMVKSVEKSVIGVSCYSNASGTTLAGTGTGGIYKKEKTNNRYKYTVFTNHHVIEDGKVIKVYLGDIEEYVVATVVKSDENLDVAVLTFEHKNEYEPLTFANVDTVNTGDFVVAIGNPGGYTYYGSVTFGIVSSNNRKMSDSNVIYVQHDSAINPGNSGGPLFNLDGEVIGINTLKLASSDIEGMGFAISLHSFLSYIQ